MFITIILYYVMTIAHMLHNMLYTTIYYYGSVGPYTTNTNMFILLRVSRTTSRRSSGPILWTILWTSTKRLISR